jgi:hypothetical protein
MFSNLFFEFGLGSISYESEYVAILEHALLLGYQLPTKNQNRLNNTKVRELKEAGIFTELDILYNFKQDVGLDDFIKINWVNPGVYNATQSNIINSPTFEPNQGFKGGTNSYLSTNYIPTSHAINAVIDDMSVFYKSYDEVQGVVAGTRNGSGNNFTIRKTDPSGGDITQLCTSTGGGGLSLFTDNSHIVHSKNGLTHSYYVNGTFNSSVNYASTSLSSVELTLFAWNLSGTPGRFFTGGIEYFALGSSYIGTKALEISEIFQ